jgi:phosphopantetheinyl transferase
MKQADPRTISLDEEALADQLSERLEIPLCVKISGEPLDERRLTAREALRFNELLTHERRDSWLRGRAALKNMLACLGEAEETAHISFPNQRLSLTHSGHYAVAVGTRSDRLLGIGVDLEMTRSVCAEAARFFLTPEEQSWVLNQKEDVQSGARLRLWTAKEALFKSDCDNQGRGLADYSVREPAKWCGRAGSRGGGEKEFRYASLQLGQVILSAAILIKG